MPSDIQNSANTHWRMLNDQTVNKAEFTSCLRLMMGDHKGSLYHYVTQSLPAELDDSIFHNLPGNKHLLNHWREYFDVAGGISQLNAPQFLLTIYNSLEEVDAAFTNQITPGTTRHKRNNFSDLITRRPCNNLGWSLHLTTKGSGTYNCIREQIVTSPGDLILLSPDALYDYHREDTCDLWEHQWVYFQQEERWLELLQWPEVGPGTYHIQAGDTDYPTLKNLFTQISDTHLASSGFPQALEKNLLEQVLIRCRQLVPKKCQSTADERIVQVRDYISRNFNQAFTASSLAAEVGLSPTRLSTLFKQQIGSTMVNFRDERRMKKAVQLLVQTQQPINKIAELVGYNDALYFSRCFSQNLNCSPSQYRNKHQYTEYKND